MTSLTINESPSAVLDRAELLRRARELGAKIKERASATALAGQVPDETARDIVDAQLNRAAVPLRYGGLDVDYTVHHEIAMELGRYCGATAWCFSLWGAHTWWVAFYSKEAQDELFANGPDVLTSSATFCVRSRQEEVPGGYRISGHWKFVSGCDHAQWVFADMKGPNGLLATIIPRSDFQVIDGTWDVSGLQGTGSKDIIVEDAFVPTHRTQLGGGPDKLYDLDDPAQQPPFGFHPQRRYSTPKSALVIWDLVAPAIGMAQGAIDEMVDRLQGTTGRPTSGDSLIVQNKISESAAEVDAARTILLARMEHAQSHGEVGDPLTVLDLTRYARDRAYAVKLAVSATNRMFDMAGGRAIFLTDPLQRIHRDVQAAMHRDRLVFDFASQPYARVLLGMDPLD